MDKKLDKIESLVALLLLATSSFPYFLQFHKISYVLVLLFLIVLVIVQKKVNYQNSQFLISTVVLLGILYFLQAIYFSFLNYILLNDFINFLVRVLIGYLSVIIIVKSNFWEHFLKLMKFFSIVSLIFYTLLLLNPLSEEIFRSIASILSNPNMGDSVATYDYSLIVFSLNIHDSTLNIVRNPGPFWEPGVFAGFLNFAIIINLLKGYKLYSSNSLLYIFCLITTFSSGGYIIFFCILVYNTFIGKKFRFSIINIIITIFAIFISILIYNTTPFLKNKVNDQISVSESGNIGRFGSAFIDLIDIKKYPILGRSRLSELRFEHSSTHEFDIDNHRVCGLTDFIVKFGIPFSFFFYYMIYKGFHRMYYTTNTEFKSIGFLLFLSFILFAFYEPITQLPFAFFLFFSFITMPKAKIYFANNF